MVLLWSILKGLLHLVVWLWHYHHTTIISMPKFPANYHTTICKRPFRVIKEILNLCFLSPLTGRSLIWVGILGVIVLYVYALLTFAVFRSSFSDDPSGQTFCDTLGHCFLAIVRYGTIGVLDEVGSLKHLQWNFSYLNHQTYNQWRLIWDSDNCK